MFIRWECGCLGIQLTNECIVIASCDSDTDDLVFATSKISVGGDAIRGIADCRKRGIACKIAPPVVGWREISAGQTVDERLKGGTMYLMDQVEDNCVKSFLARQHFVPPFREEQLSVAQKLEIWATSFTDPGPDYCVFKLYDSNRRLIAENVVSGY